VLDFDADGIVGQTWEEGEDAELAFTKRFVSVSIGRGWDRVGMSVMARKINSISEQGSCMAETHLSEESIPNGCFHNPAPCTQLFVR
jgi:hypothetical protein